MVCLSGERELSAINAVFVIGHSPAVLTETLAGAVHREPGLRFAEISVISTRSGADLLRHRLFDEGGWEAFLDEWPEFSGTLFSAHNIMALACEDIRSEQDNRKLVETVLQLVCRLTAEGEPPLLASLAGGRKTMGYYMGFAMSLFGRPGDRLTHVLVPGEWERDPDFLVPRRDEVDRIDLVDIPFIRVRGHVDPALDRADTDALLQSAQTAIDMAAMEPVTLNVRKRTMQFLGHEIPFSEREFAFIQFFAEEKLDHCRHPERPHCIDCSDCFLSYDEIDAKKKDLLRIRAQFGGIGSRHYQRFEDSWTRYERAARDNVSDPVRRIAEAIEAEFGVDPRAEKVKIRNVGERRNARYGIMADKRQLRLKQR